MIKNTIKIIRSSCLTRGGGYGVCRSVIYALLFATVIFLSSLHKAYSAHPATITSWENLLSGIEEQALVNWEKGKAFVYMDEQLHILIQPEETMENDKKRDYRGSVWHYDAMVLEENWLGLQELSLRFLSPDGEKFRFDTGRSSEVISDTTYRVTLPGFYSLEIIESLDSILRGCQLYLLVNDASPTELLTSDTTRKVTQEKFMPVTIDSVSYGKEMAPIRVYYSHSQGSASVMTALPHSKESASVMSLERLFAFENPRQKYPNITSEVWNNICLSEVVFDMTAEEVRLSVGRPMQVERMNTHGGVWEVWVYRSGLAVQLLDGRVRRTGRK